ncbi:ClpP/crotonase-like domain-containing protein [Tribonema minus]|uniref:ClpP/crotonase-like domain-containing protein n=1 Tax=Tribonema minus TaxID=303371 RepID=A0A835ZBJ2_9STRA|nr:ClpP/crotonase-like domain-containing protein [Tribonema minus]
MKAVVHFRKLLVAAVNGPAVGIGVTMLPHCDLVVCAQKATFWTPFGRLAIVPELCSSVTFPELMGYSKATEMLVLGQKLSAKEALQAKLVSRIYPSEGFLEQVESSLVQSLLSLPFGQQSALHYKQTMLAARLPRMEAALATEFVELDKRLRSGAPQAALRALGAPGGTQSRL